MKKRYIYVTNGVIPKAFTSARKALENLWALEAPIPKEESEKAGNLWRRSQFIKDGAKCLRKGAVVAPHWSDNCPKITPTEIYG